jgi:putative ABC transport system permease protein
MFIDSIRMALKVLRRRKFFTFISLFAISFTLLVLIVASAMLDHLFGAHEPHAPFDRMVGVYMVKMTGENIVETGLAPYWLLDRYLHGLDGAERVSIIQSDSQVISFNEDHVIRSQLKRTDGEFWRIYDFDFIEGGPFTQHDEEQRSFVAVINEATRDRFFGGAPAFGRTIDVDGQPFRVVGVVRNVPKIRLVPFADIWTPLSTAKSFTDREAVTGNYLGIVIARTPGDIPGLKREFADRISRIEMTPAASRYTEAVTGLYTPFEALSRAMFDDDGASGLAAARRGRLQTILLAGALLFMLLPAVNLVNLNVSRMLERSSEIGVRKAFGASSRRLISQFVLENIVITILGGAIGLIAAAGVLSFLNRLDLIAYSQFAINWRIAFYALAFAIVFGIVSGLFPAWRMSRLHPVDALRGRTA